MATGMLLTPAPVRMQVTTTGQHHLLLQTLTDSRSVEAAIRVWADSTPTPEEPLKSRANTADKRERARKTGADLPCVDPSSTPL
ncbi:uncharacterized [Lates japonicus]